MSVTIVTAILEALWPLLEYVVKALASAGASTADIQRRVRAFCFEIDEREKRDRAGDIAAMGLSAEEPTSPGRTTTGALGGPGRVGGGK